MAKSFYTTGTGDEQTLTPIINEKVPIYDTVADAESDLANLEVGQIVKTKDAGLVANLNPIDEVKQGVFLPPTSNAVAKSLSYSTTEQKTGGKWIDGRDIYRKVIHAQSITFPYSVASLNIDYLVDMRAIGNNNSGHNNWISANLGTQGDIYLTNDKANIAINTFDANIVFTDIILEYTKNE